MYGAYQWGSGAHQDINTRLSLAPRHFQGAVNKSAPPGGQAWNQPTPETVLPN